MIVFLKKTKITQFIKKKGKKIKLYKINNITLTKKKINCKNIKYLKYRLIKLNFINFKLILKNVIKKNLNEIMLLNKLKFKRIKLMINCIL